MTTQPNLIYNQTMLRMIEIWLVMKKKVSSYVLQILVTNAYSIVKKGSWYLVCYIEKSLLPKLNLILYMPPDACSTIFFFLLSFQVKKKWLITILVSNHTEMMNISTKQQYTHSLFSNHWHYAESTVKLNALGTQLDEMTFYFLQCFIVLA